MQCDRCNRWLHMPDCSGEVNESIFSCRRCRLQNLWDTEMGLIKQLRHDTHTAVWSFKFFYGPVLSVLHHNDQAQPWSDCMRLYVFILFWPQFLKCFFSPIVSAYVHAVWSQSLLLVVNGFAWRFSPHMLNLTDYIFLLHYMLPLSVHFGYTWLKQVDNNYMQLLFVGV